MGGASADKPNPTAPSQSELALGKQAKDYEKNYETLYMPAEKTVLERMQATPERIAQAQGRVATDLSSQVIPAAENATRVAALSRGGGMGSGRSAMDLAGVYDTLGSARMGGSAKALTATNQAEKDNLQKMVDFGQGLSSANTAGFENASSIASQAAQAQLNTALVNRQTAVNHSVDNFETAMSGITLAAAGGKMAYNKYAKDPPKYDPNTGKPL